VLESQGNDNNETISEENLSNEEGFNSSQNSSENANSQRDSSEDDDEREVGIFEDFVLFQELMCTELKTRVYCIKQI